MKTFLFPILAGLLTLSSVALGQTRLKMATVSMERLFNEYHRTAEVQRDIQKIREQLSTANLGEKERLSLNDEQRELSQDGKQRQRERTQYLERRNRALSEKMRKQMRAILVKIQRTVSERAKEGNYDFILDASGKSNQGIPFVIHARDTTDLTDSLLKEINEDAEVKDGE